MLGKTFKGMTDDLLAWQTSGCRRIETHREGITGLRAAGARGRVAFNGLQDRPALSASGLALRFARVVRYREDKKPETPTRSRPSVHLTPRRCARTPTANSGQGSTPLQTREPGGIGPHTVSAVTAKRLLNGAQHGFGDRVGAIPCSTWRPSAAVAAGRTPS